MLCFTLIMFLLHTSKCDETDEREKIEWCKPLQRQKPPGDVIALASFPGSGNTWLRYLLQQATGILTGSLYYDDDLKRNGFPAETVIDGSVLVVKTHQNYPYKKFKCKSAILLIRYPKDAILSGYHYLLSGHTSIAPRSAFNIDALAYFNARRKRKASPQLPTTDEGWESFVNNSMEIWESFYESWLTSDRPLHIMFYEDLVKNTRRELKEVLKFINFNASESDINCTMQRSEGVFKRVQKHKNFEPFNDVMIQNLVLMYDRILALIEEHRIKTTIAHNNAKMFNNGGRPSVDTFGLMLDFLIDNTKQKKLNHYIAHKKHTDKKHMSDIHMYKQNTY